LLKIYFSNSKFRISPHKTSIQTLIIKNSYVFFNFKIATDN